MTATFSLRVDGADFTSIGSDGQFAVFQTALARAHANRKECLCLCRSPGVPMVIYRRDLFFVRRFPGTAQDHAEDCRSHLVFDNDDQAEESVELNYRASLFVKTHAPGVGDVAPERRGRRSAPPIRESTLLDIAAVIWRAAGLCRWSPNHRAWPWVKVASALEVAAATIRIGKDALVDRLILLDCPSETSKENLTELIARQTARRNIGLVLSPVKTVFETKRDVCIVPYGSDPIWAADNSCAAQFEAAMAVARQLPGSYLLGVMAVHAHRNLRCTDWAFVPVTHAWHQFSVHQQGLLYQRLVDDRRKFSIPNQQHGGAPWAVVYDSHGGPRAIVSKSAPPINTFYPQWEWDPQSPLPRQEAIEV